MKSSAFVLALFSGLGFSGTARATLLSLEDVGGGLAHINFQGPLNFTGTTVLKDVNYAWSSGYWGSHFSSLGRSPGQMTWSEAKAWADQLVYGGHDDWRLAGADSCVGSCAFGGTEISAIFQGLGGIAGQSITVTHNSSYSSFSNFETTDLRFWTGAEFTFFPSGPTSPVFNFGGGFQDRQDHGNLHYAIAVRGSILEATYNGVALCDYFDKPRDWACPGLGDPRLGRAEGGGFFRDGILVEVATPEPGSIWLLSLGLAAIGPVSVRKRRNSAAPAKPCNASSGKEKAR